MSNNITFINNQTKKKLTFHISLNKDFSKIYMIKYLYYFIRFLNIKFVNQILKILFII